MFGDTHWICLCQGILWVLTEITPVVPHLTLKPQAKFVADDSLNYSFLFFRENKSRHFMRKVCQADDSGNVKTCFLLIKPFLDKDCLFLSNMEPLTPDHVCPKNFNKSILLPAAVSKTLPNEWPLRRPWSDATFFGIWSGSTLFAQACLSQYLGLLRYFTH